MKFLSIAALLTLFAAPALAGPVGEWRIADGTANVAIKPCGANLCGFVSWSKDGENVVGKQVLLSMRPERGRWSGTIVNVRDGQRYSARMTMVSDESLKVEGCVMGGLICGGQHWSRLR